MKHKNVPIKYDTKFQWIERDIGPEWEQWAHHCEKWLGRKTANRKSAIRAVRNLITYLKTNAVYASNVVGLFKTNDTFIKQKFYDQLPPSGRKLMFLTVDLCDQIVKELGKTYPSIKNPFDVQIDTNRRPKISTDTEFTWIERDFGPEWGQWSPYAKRWIATKTTRLDASIQMLRHLIKYLSETTEHAADIVQLFKAKDQQFEQAFYDYLPSSQKRLHSMAADFCQHVMKGLDDKCHSLQNPFFKKIDNKAATPIEKDTDLQWIERELGPDWALWSSYCRRWNSDTSMSWTSSIRVIRYFMKYLHQNCAQTSDVISLFRTKDSLFEENYCKSLDHFSRDPKRLFRKGAVSLCEYILQDLAQKDKSLQNPFVKTLERNKKTVPVHQDTNFTWITREIGPEWSEWAYYCKNWLLNKTANRQNAIRLVRAFIKHLSAEAPYAFNVVGLFKKNDELFEQKFLSSLPSSQYKFSYIVADLCEHILLYLDRGNSTYHNPFAQTIEAKNATPYLKDTEFTWIEREFGNDWSQWTYYCKNWLAADTRAKDGRINATRHFIKYLFDHAPYAAGVISLFQDKDDSFDQKFNDSMFYLSEDVRRDRRNKVADLCEFIVHNLGETNEPFKNPFFEVIEAKNTKIHYSLDAEYSWITRDFGPNWLNFQGIISEWSRKLDKKSKSPRTRPRAIKSFLQYSLTLKKVEYDPVKLCQPRNKSISSKAFLKYLFSTGIKENSEVPYTYNRAIRNLFEFIVERFEIEYTEVLENPFEWLISPNNKSGRSKKGYTRDLNLRWIVSEHGRDWEQWRQYISEWLKTGTGVKQRLETVSYFISYLKAKAPYACNVPKLFIGLNGHNVSSQEFSHFVKSKGIKYRHQAVPTIIRLCEFILDHKFSAENDQGHRVRAFANPFKQLNTKGVVRSESVHSALPIKYMEGLRHILCPYSNDPEEPEKPWSGHHFRDWQWAINENAGSKRSGGWIEVPVDRIDPTDPDCVHRTRTISQRQNKGREIKIHEIWSPVSAMALFVKLHLPLRTHQVRFLDSGEADTWRYDSGQWVLNNKHNFRKGTVKKTYTRGIFHRIIDRLRIDDSPSVGLFVSTNKTADRNKDPRDQGYTIPWEHHELLYWLEKLRNWQEKYNPIDRLTDGTELEAKHIGQPKNKEQLQEMGKFAFLFRDASGRTRERHKPITDAKVADLWYKLLLEFENQLDTRDERLSGGGKIVLVERSTSKRHKRSAVHFPLHSLRVSLITCYAISTNLPMPVISKLLAGHSRLLMTLYYCKPNAGQVTRMLEEAKGQLRENAEADLSAFLQSWEHTNPQSNSSQRIVYNEDKYSSALEAIRQGNPTSWEARALGVCLAGGNTAPAEEAGRAPGCWNGGPITHDSKEPDTRQYSMVPGGAGNCVRCRWFVTDATYMLVLNARANQLSYLANESASLAKDIEDELEELKNEKYQAELSDVPFTKSDKLRELARRSERQWIEADETAKDYAATFDLLWRTIEVENNRSKDDNSQKMVAVGSQDDVEEIRLNYSETDSELFQLSLLCEDAEIYPDMYDNLRKTSAVAKRNNYFVRMLAHRKIEPALLELDEHSQFLAVNAMTRKMAQALHRKFGLDKMEGYRRVASVVEGREHLADTEIWDASIDELRSLVSMKLTSQPIKNLDVI